MPDRGYILAAVFICAFVTFTLRALPFAALEPLRGSAIVGYLSRHMPVGVMLILAAYTIRDVRPTELASVAPIVAALAATITLHMWRRNAVLSTVCGTGLYVLLANFLAI